MTKRTNLDGPVEPALCRCGHKHYLHHNGLGSVRGKNPGCTVQSCTCTGYRKAATCKTNARAK